MKRLLGLVVLFAASVASAEKLPSIVPTSNIPLDDAPISLVAADFNGDGNVDLAVGLLNGSVRIFSGDGRGGFVQTGSYLNGETGFAIAATDLNGDGHPDLAVVVPGVPVYQSVVAILLNDGDGHFTPGQRVSLPASAFSVTVADFNRDGHPDLAIAIADAGIAILLGNGDGTMTDDPRLRIPTKASQIAAGDFNGDGMVDLVYGFGFSGIGMLPGRGDGTFGDPIVTQAFGSIPMQLAVADMNGDGRLDVVAGQLNDVSAYVFFGNGDGTFAWQFLPVAYPSQFPIGYPLYVALADFNNDGRMDVAALNVFPESQNAYSLVLNTGGGTFAPPRITQTGGLKSKAIIAADFNNDGFPDIAIAATDLHLIEIHLSVPVARARRRTVLHR